MCRGISPAGVLAACVAGWILAAAVGCSPAAAPPKGDAEKKPPADTAKWPQAEGAPAEKMVPLEIPLPRPVAGGTPRNIVPSEHLAPYTAGPRPPLAVPEGTTNVALQGPVTSSDPEPIIGELGFVTDGAKEGTEGNIVELGPGLQWVQIDLGKPCAIYAVVVWHAYGDNRVYHDVVVQAADDVGFTKNVRTLFNNDYDGTAGLGDGKDLEYIEDHRGHRIDAHGAAARYVRLWSRGNSSNDQNHYVEVEVYGKAAP